MIIFLHQSKASSVFISLSMLLAFLFLVSGCGVKNADMIKEQNEFAIKSAKMGLWNEAILRWKRIVEIDPKNAKAFNNIGVAYEAKGEFDAALISYKTATELDPGNKIYMNNYNRFKKNYEKSQKKSDEQISNSSS